MFDYDRSNFISFLNSFPEQIQRSQELMANLTFDLDVAGLQNIVLSGMGGSGISGDLLLGYTADEITLPTFINRDYTIPGFVNEHTLFVAVSYSGDTEETLSAMAQAAERSARLVGISSGGKVEQYCQQHHIPHIKIPGGFPPRQALGYLFFPALFLFEKLGLISSKTAEVAETRELLQELIDRYSPVTSYGNNLAHHIAQSVYHAIPVVYTGAPFLQPVTVRWRNQFNENSKSMAFSNVFPELNHNEIMGWEGLKEVNKHFRVILLRDPEESPRVKQRINITKEILKNRQILFGEVFAEGQSRLARLFSLISAGDWASYYWAMLNEKDPITIDSIDLLKEKLSKTNV
ncbi:MAG: bifunctional phosphoglucose/phosphomannose isomerase [Calditrichaeota bacterium]|nr:bifunctional phosphoglucose/phosphomannose isomerase [Calditrichota bacterium]